MLLQFIEYELRIYDVENLNLKRGRVLKARRVNAAHCLTCCQFSPSGEYLLASYGKRHLSICSYYSSNGAVQLVYNVLEVRLIAVIAVRQASLDAPALHLLSMGGPVLIRSVVFCLG